MIRSIQLCFIFIAFNSQAQEVLRIKNGEIVSIQNGVNVAVMGGLTLEDGSGLANNGTIYLKNNSIANSSDWKDLSSSGAMIGMGKVVFNSMHHQYFSGLTEFYKLQINTGGLGLNDHLLIDDQLELVTGKINTGNLYAFLRNNSAAALLNDISNSGYINSWINGNFRRMIASNTDTYDFPVGNETRSNLLQFKNNNITGPAYLTASFGPKPGSDAGLNVSESGVSYNTVNNGGVWYLVPDAQATGGNFTLHLYFNGFTGLTNNQFGILQRQDASSNAADWVVPSGSMLEGYNGLGRKVSDGFARRINISDFSQWGIGMAGSIVCEDCITACTYSQGFYGNTSGIACYNNSFSPVSSSQVMLNAFGAATTNVFGNIPNRRFFTLYKTDITAKNIFKMLPGSGNSQPIAVDNILPYNGAYYSDQGTWNLVPLQPNGPQKGRINNQLLSQLITLWFNLRTSTPLSSIGLDNDTLVTVAQTDCGSGVASGMPLKFGLPHDVMTYLNGANGYSNNIQGLFQFANDVLGGVNTAVSPLDVQLAVAAINSAFDGCRILTGTIAYVPPPATTKIIVREKEASLNIANELTVTAYPNPSVSSFNIIVSSNNENDRIVMQVVDMYGRVIETRNVKAYTLNRFGDHYRPGIYFVRIMRGKEQKEVKLIKLPD
jgi:hypothetical protein